MKTPVYISNIPSPDPNFVGRDYFFEKLNLLMESGESVLLITGIGGAGKTAIIREFCHRYRRDFDHFIWINAENGILENLAQDRNLRDNLEIETSFHNTAETAQRIINKLNELEGNNLLVLDNIDEEFHQFRKIMPIRGSWKVLASSRIEFNEVSSLQLGALTETEALELFYKHYHLQQNDEVVLELFKPLSYHALTIELFARTAQFHKLPLNDLLKRATALGFNFSKKLNISIEHSNTVVENLGKYYEKIFPVDQNPSEEIKILRQFVLLPGNFTEMNDLFKLLSVSREDDDTFSYHLNRLVQKGWIENFGTSYKLNQIIRKFIEFKYPVNIEFYLPQAIKLAKLLSVDTVRDSPVSTFKWLLYGQEFLHYFQFEKDEIVTMANNLALRYRDNGNFEVARNILEKVMEYDLKTYGEDNNIVELSRANLGNLYSDLGNYKKASKLLEKSLQSALKNFPANHPKIAVRQSNLGLVYRDLGNLLEASRLLKAALDTDLSNYSKDHPNVAVRQSNLALVYKDLGEYKMSKDLLEESIATAIKHYGEKHPRVALRFSNLALVYKAMGEYRKAIDLLEKALESDLDNFGEMHPKVAVRLMNISIIYLEINEMPIAYDRISRAYKIALATLGTDHPDTLIIKKMYYGFFEK